MIKIDEYFSRYPNNIIGFRVNNNIKIIDFWLNSKWELLKEIDGITVKKQKNNDDNSLTYYIMFSESFDFDYLYQYVSDIIEHNLDIEKKQELFKDKLSALKKLFMTLSYDELTQIQFENTHSLNKNNPIVSDEVEEMESLSTSEPNDEHTNLTDNNKD